MCGIAGIIASNGESPEASVVRRMVALLRHRGPDGSGVEPRQEAVLGHARLSIIDLTGGSQPMSTEDGRLTITFNGEIYNYLEIKRDLERAGQRFVTRSDTEVVLQAFALYGPDCVPLFNGQFAFAIWDARDNRLFLARDRFGKKPLYFASLPNQFVFASEMKAVLAHPQVSQEIDVRGLDQVLTFWHTTPPRTIFRDVRELPPGHSMVVHRGQVQTQPYWSLEFAPDELRRSEADYADELLNLLVDAVKLRMLRSDVPVGAYISGGLDSTVIAGLIRRHTDVPLKTFSVAFEDREFDESPFQREVVRHLGITDHAEALCTAEDIGTIFPDVIWHTEQPIVRTAPAPLMMLSRLVRQQGYKVVLTGEGSDEVLGGYDIFKEAKVRRFCATLPGSRSRPRLLKRLYPYMPSLQRQTPAALQAFFYARPEDLDHLLFSHMPRWQMTSGIKSLLSDDVRTALNGHSALDERSNDLPASYPAWDPFCQAQYLEASGLLPGYILSSQGDRVQMANSVEGRCPFLDHRIATFASRLPVDLKMKVLNEKYILKRAAQDVIPQFLRKRPKQPYRTTDVPSFFNETTRQARFDWVSEALSGPVVKRAGLFTPEGVARLVAQVRAGRQLGVRDGMALVAVLSTQLVLDQFTERLGRVA